MSSERLCLRICCAGAAAAVLRGGGEGCCDIAAVGRCCCWQVLLVLPAGNPNKVTDVCTVVLTALVGAGRVWWSTES